MGLKQSEKIEQDKKDFLVHLAELHGNVKQAGAKIGITWPHDWVAYHSDKDPDFAEKYEQIRAGIKNELLDDAESILYEKVFIKKETNAVLYFLKCQGKARGWIEYKEFEGTGKPVVIKIERIVSDGKAEERIQLENEDALSSERNIQ